MSKEFIDLISQNNDSKIDYLNSLSKIINKFELEEMLFDKLTQFNPRLNKDGTFQSYIDFLQEMFEGEILWYFFKIIGSKKFTNNDIAEDYALEYYNFYLNSHIYPLKDINILNETEEDVIKYLEKYYSDNGLNIKFIISEDN